jgi:hypothetical protein
LQVDLITLAPEHFDSNYNYLSYNDLGNFLGALMHQFKFKVNVDGSEVDCILKYGQEGFFVKAYYETHKLGDFVISKDYPKIYSFLGLDYNEWLTGFNELDEIFKFISKSKYFSSEIFQIKNLNKINRERNLKRKSYMTFLDWMDNSDSLIKTKYSYTNNYILEKLDIEFPEFNEVIDNFKNKISIIKKNKLLSEKFNGNIIMENFGLTGKELGLAITKFKNNYGSKFDEFILMNEKEVILNDFKKFL